MKKSMCLFVMVLAMVSGMGAAYAELRLALVERVDEIGTNKQGDTIYRVDGFFADSPDFLRREPGTLDTPKKGFLVVYCRQNNRDCVEGIKSMRKHRAAGHCSLMFSATPTRLRTFCKDIDDEDQVTLCKTPTMRSVSIHHPFCRTLVSFAKTKFSYNPPKNTESIGYNAAANKMPYVRDKQPVDVMEKAEPKQSFFLTKEETISRGFTKTPLKKSAGTKTHSLTQSEDSSPQMGFACSTVSGQGSSIPWFSIFALFVGLICAGGPRKR